MLNRDYQEDQDLSNINFITLEDNDDDSDQLKKRILTEKRNFHVLFPNNFLNLQQSRPHYHNKYGNFDKLIKLKHHRSSLGIADDSTTLKNSTYSNELYSPNLHINQGVGNCRGLDTPLYGSMIDLSINGRHWMKRGIDKDDENSSNEDAQNSRFIQSTMNSERISYPFYANSEDFSRKDDDQYANFVCSSTSRSMLSRNNSFLDLQTTKNMIERPCFATDRFKQRLAACQLGLRELELLRNKHKHLIWQVKTQVMAPLMERTADEAKNSIPECQDSTTSITSFSHRQTQRCHSPAPSSGESSNVSYRSSMSTDSGWMSMGAADHARHSSNDSNSTIQKIDNSLIAEEDENRNHMYENLGYSKQPTYCGTNLIDKLNNRLSKSYVCIENGNIVEEERGTPSPPKAPFRYRRRGLQPPTDHHRPKSLYIYPDKQDSNNNYANAEYGRLRNNYIYANSDVKGANNRNNRRLSVAMAPEYYGHLTREPIFTWDEVKAMLENDFGVTNVIGTPCQKNHCCTCPPVPAAVARLQASCRPMVNRSLSVQSVEGSSKYKRCREKLWRESDCL